MPYLVLSLLSSNRDIEDNSTEVDCHSILTHNSMRFSITMHSLSGVVNKIPGNSCTSLHTRGNAHGSRVSSSLHQTVTWSLSSPFYGDTLHLTGVYVFPDEGKLEEFFDGIWRYVYLWISAPGIEPRIP